MNLNYGIFPTGAVGKESGTGLDLVVPHIVQHLKE